MHRIQFAIGCEVEYLPSATPNPYYMHTGSVHALDIVLALQYASDYQGSMSDVVRSADIVLTGGYCLGETQTSFCLGNVNRKR